MGGSDGGGVCEPAFRMSFGGAWTIRRVESEAEAKARAALRAVLDDMAERGDESVRERAAVYRMASYRLPTGRMAELVDELQREAGR